MKKLALHKVLALAIGQTSMHIAEVSTHGQRHTVERVAQFVYPTGASLSNPTALGQALRQFLRASGFATRDAVLGLPAKCLVTRRKEVPPATPDMAAGVLRMQAESEFADLVFDFAGQTSRTAPTTVLLIATARTHIDTCTLIATAAGLRLRAVSATAAALARQTHDLTNKPGLVLSLSGAAAELIVNLDQAPEQFRHVPANVLDPANLGLLVGEIRRTLAALPSQTNPLDLALWNDLPDDSTAKILSERLAMPVTSPTFNPLASTPGTDVNGSSPAVALALSALDPAGLPVDFLHSRLAPPPVQTNKRPITIGIVAGAAIVLALAAGFTDITIKQHQLDQYRADSAAQSKAVLTAQAAASRLAEARRWTIRKPRYIACLRDLTALFPDEGTICATSMTLSSSNKGILAGKAASEPQVRAFKDRLLSSKQFTEVMYEIHEGARTSAGSPETSFSITFNYRAPE